MATGSGGRWWGVEVTDIAFSIDSILAAVATAEALPRRLGGIELFTIPGVNVVLDVKLLVIYIGGILGIIAMRFVAGYFLILLDRFQGLAKGAYYLVGWIGLKLLGGGLDGVVHPSFELSPGNWRESLPLWVKDVPWEINAWAFWSVMGMIIVASLLAKPRSKGVDPSTPSELVATAQTHE